MSDYENAIEVNGLTKIPSNLILSFVKFQFYFDFYMIFPS